MAWALASLSLVVAVVGVVFIRDTKIGLVDRRLRGSAIVEPPTA
jgi:hypothetical protein